MMKLICSERDLQHRFLVRYPALIMFIVMFFPHLTVKAQILNDSVAINIITKGMYNIYNMDFDGAEEAYKEVASLYPDHPVLDLYSGMMIYWKNFPMMPSSGESLEFEDRMRRCIEESENYSPPGIKNEFYNGVSYIFRGIIAEKKYKDNVLASSYYKTGIGILGRFGSYTNEYAAYGYFGLSRIGEDSADKHERKVNHRKAMELADFKKITFDD